MLPTPSTDHVPFAQVYEPAEDSFLLLDSLSGDTERIFLRKRFGPQISSNGRNALQPRQDIRRSIPASPLILEVGTGSGVVLAFVNAHADRLFGRRDVLTLGTDVNGFACAAAPNTVMIASQANEKGADDEGTKTRPYSSGSSSSFQGIIQADLASPLRAGSVDVLIFNPPYVPSAGLPNLDIAKTWSSTDKANEHLEGFERDSYLLSLSYAGGMDGMEVTNRLLGQIPVVLSRPLGVAYVVLCAQNRPERFKERIKGWDTCWRAETVGRSGKKGGWEKLQVIRIWRAI